MNSWWYTAGIERLELEWQVFYVAFAAHGRGGLMVVKLAVNPGEVLLGIFTWIVVWLDLFPSVPQDIFFRFAQGVSEFYE